MKMMKPIYIHRSSIVSGLGCDTGQTWKNVVENTSCFTERDGIAVAEVSDERFRNFKPDYKPYPRLDRSTQLALFAASGLNTGEELRNASTIIAIGSSRGATQTWEEAYAAFSESGGAAVLDSPTTTAGQLASNVGAWLRMDHHIDIDQSITCASGLRAMADACAWLNAGFAEQAIAGGAEAPLTPFTFAQMKALKIMGGNGEWPCRSLDPNLTSNTMVLGEGSVLFHLSAEAVPDAVRIVGVGFATETGVSATGLSSDGQCLQDSMRRAVQSAGWDRPDAVIAHAPGTIKGDRAELAAIDHLFGTDMPVTSTKYFSGHCFGSSGPLSVWLAERMMKEQHWVSPSWNTRPQPDNLNRIIVNAVGFGANAVSLAVEYHRSI